MSSPSETTALLPAQNGTSTEPRPERRQIAPRYVLALVCISIITIDFGAALSFAPLIEIYELLICRDFLGHNPGENNTICKSSPVQDELVFLNGWKSTFDQIPGIALGLLYGLVADRIGRKPVVLLALTGLLLQELFIRLFSWWNLLGLVPLRAIWVTSLFQLIGGGSGVATSMAYSMIVDSFPPNERYVLS
jgi:MFS family permease